MLYLLLFMEFFRAGLFAIGGGLATLPFLYDISDRTGWFTHAQLTDMVAISESTPGPIGINCATYVGYTAGEAQYGMAGGILGSVIATMGLICPALIVIILISKILKRFSDSKIVAYIFFGFRAASVAMIAAACVSVVKLSLLQTELYHETGVLTDLLNWKGILLALILFGLMSIKKLDKIHPGIYILGSAVIGIVFCF
jgi:chromate transporter